MSERAKQIRAELCFLSGGGGGGGGWGVVGGSVTLNNNNKYIINPKCEKKMRNCHKVQR